MKSSPSANGDSDGEEANKYGHLVLVFEQLYRRLNICASNDHALFDQRNCKWKERQDINKICNMVSKESYT
jgi:hypothetical protein